MRSNPFKFGKVVSENAFCDRREETKALEAYINDSISVWLYSPRRYGKSSLIKHVFYQLKDVETIYVDLYNVQSIEDFAKRYATLIAEHLFDWKGSLTQLTQKLTSYFKNLKPTLSFNDDGPAFSLSSEKINSQVEIETILDVPHQISKKSGKKICIAFDEFQEISRIDPFLINWMRSSFQHHENISYIFLGSKQSLMESIFTSYNSPFYEFGVKMDIQAIDFNDLREFLKRQFHSCNITIHDDVVESILNISEGHPHFTQFFASEIFYLLNSGHNQNDSSFNDLWLTQVIEGQSHIFQNIYDQLTNIQRVTLWSIARTTEDEELFSERSRAKYSLPGSSTLNTTLQGLIKKDLIAKVNSKYHVFNPVFKQWLLTLKS